MFLFLGKEKKCDKISIGIHANCRYSTVWYLLEGKSVSEQELHYISLIGTKKVQTMNSERYVWINQRQ